MLDPDTNALFAELDAGHPVLVLQDLGVYEDARAFCDWLEPAEWFDTRGPMETARWLEIDREKLFKLAEQTADYVAATKGARALEPMSAADRRFIHIALKERRDVITASEGRDPGRFVVIWPAEDD